MKADFRYPDGTEMMAGDRVIVDGGHRAVVELILTPGTKIASTFNCKEMPVYVLRRDDLGLVEESDTDFDIVFIERGEPTPIQWDKSKDVA